MINVIVPIVENPQEFENFVNAHKNSKTKFFVGVRQSLAKQINLKGVDLHIFADNANKEQIINSLHSCALSKGKILIVRRPLSDSEFSALTNSTKEIASLKGHHNKFVSAIKRLAQKVIRKVFAFEYFEDISGICFSESMFELLSVCSNLSMASRINRYVGVESEEFETNAKSVKKDYSRLKNLALLLVGILVFVGSVAGGVLVCIFFPLHVLNVILVIFWILVALGIFLITLVNFTRTVAVGKLRYGRAEEIIKEKKERKHEKN